MFELTQDYLKECLNFDPSTGIFVWRHRPREHFTTNIAFKAVNSRFAGKIAASASGQGKTTYTTIGVNGKAYYAHRLAWLYMFGKFPVDQIDHINGDGTCNKIINLREASHSENARNCSLFKTNTSLYNGVYFDSWGNRWRARIGARGREENLGSFKTKFAAVYARHAANLKYEYHKNHGRVNCQ